MDALAVVAGWGGQVCGDICMVVVVFHLALVRLLVLLLICQLSSFKNKNCTCVTFTCLLICYIFALFTYLPCMHAWTLRQTLLHYHKCQNFEFVALSCTGDDPMEGISTATDIGDLVYVHVLILTSWLVRLMPVHYLIMVPISGTIPFQNPQSLIVSARTVTFCVALSNTYKYTSS